MFRAKLKLAYMRAFLREVVIYENTQSRLTRAQAKPRIFSNPPLYVLVPYILEPRGRPEFSKHPELDQRHPEPHALDFFEPCRVSLGYKPHGLSLLSDPLFHRYELSWHAAGRVVDPHDRLSPRQEVKQCLLREPHVGIEEQNMGRVSLDRCLYQRLPHAMYVRSLGRVQRDSQLLMGDLTRRPPK